MIKIDKQENENHLHCNTGDCITGRMYPFSTLWHIIQFNHIDHIEINNVKDF